MKDGLQPQSPYCRAGLLFAVVRIADWLPYPAFNDFGASELREFVIAWFLTWYLISYPVRLARSTPALIVRGTARAGAL